MKFTIEKLKVGEQVTAQVAEVLIAGQILVSFRGDLVRVENRTHLRLAAGDRIRLRVTSIDPLGFQLVPDTRLGRALDVSI